MHIEVTEEPLTDDYQSVPIAFEVHCVLDVAPDGNVLSERPLDVPYVKDYGDGPAQWAEAFDVTNWGSIAARCDGRRVGGAVVAFDTPGVTMLEGRGDLAVLWDIRILPEVRGKGVGFALFRAVERWAIARGCRQLKIETQNINVPACRFYERQGCVLGGIHRFAYPELPEEIQLLWYKALPA